MIQLNLRLRQNRTIWNNRTKPNQKEKRKKKLGTEQVSLTKAHRNGVAIDEHVEVSLAVPDAAVSQAVPGRQVVAGGRQQLHVLG
jgi:hypothetical protein